MAQARPATGSESPATAGAPAWAQALFARGLAPQVVEAETGQSLVFAPTGSVSDAAISDQFRGNAAEYHQRYAHSDHFERLFRQALTAAPNIPPSPTILDLGTGSGVNSVVPCLSLFEGCRIIATDLSPELLAMLADYARTAGASGEVVCVAMDAMGEDAREAAFDLVTGASILHHLERPAEGLAAAARALKPGGTAIFFEPFDGYGLMRLAYERILAEADLRGDPLHPAVEKTLRDMIWDITVRSAPDPDGPIFKGLDDKWLFNRDGMEAMAREAGFAEARVLAHKDHERIYQMMAAVQVRLSSGQADLTLPDWAMAILKSHDEAITAAGKRMLMLEGTLVARR